MFFAKETLIPLRCCDSHFLFVYVSGKVISCQSRPNSDSEEYLQTQVALKISWK